MHQTAGAEEHFLACEIGMSAGSVDMDEPVGCYLFGKERRRLGDRSLLLCMNPFQEGCDVCQIIGTQFGYGNSPRIRLAV